LRSGSPIAGGQLDEDRTMRRIAIATAGLALTFAAGLVSASEASAGAAPRVDRCAPAPDAQFRSEGDLVEAVERYGYRVVRVGTEGGCYAVQADDRRGRRFDMRFEGTNLRMVSRYFARSEGEAFPQR